MKDCDNTYYTTHDHHLLWMKSKQILSTNKSTSPMNASFNPTKHFHEPLVGVMWPPRSYTCSFCKRKFRSAQALGGHMNVHRRDRAKLKQSPNSPQKQPTTRLQRHSSHYQETGIPNLRKYDFPQENASSWNNPSFQDHRPVSSSLDKKVASCQKIMTVKDGKSCKKNVKYSSECSSMEDIDLELRLGHSPTTRM